MDLAGATIQIDLTKCTTQAIVFTAGIATVVAFLIFLISYLIRRREGQEAEKESTECKERTEEDNSTESTARADKYHDRAGNSHAEARKLLTVIAVGSLGVLYATLFGEGAQSASKLCILGIPFAIGIVVSMTSAAIFGFAAWRADAKWAYEVGRYFQKNKTEVEGKPWNNQYHDKKQWYDRWQLILVGIGLLFTALLTLKLIFTVALQ